jgi:ComF family protein
MIRRLADALLAALLAPPCAVCQRVLDHALAGAVCEDCWRAVSVTATESVACDPLQRAAAIGEYEGVLREIIHALKYDGRRSTAPGLARLMAQHGEQVLAGADAVVPVPLHPRRERERGFNQADDLARALPLPVARVLRRTRVTAPQVGLSAHAREQNVTGAFALGTPGVWASPERGSVRGSVLVLVDDVTTTGATLAACARALKRAGAKEVRALTAARVATAPR